MQCDLGRALVVAGDAFEKSAFDLRVFNLLLNVEVHCVVVRRELVALEELDGRLVELDHDDLVQETEALDVLACRRDARVKLSDALDLIFLAHEKGLQSIAAIFDRLQHFDLLVSPLRLEHFLLLHRVLFRNRFENGLDI